MTDTSSQFNEYLGDGLYADYDGYQIEVYASNGLRKTNVVYFDPDVLRAFIRYAARLKEAQKEAQTIAKGLIDGSDNGSGSSTESV